jgi:hypothetical protein
LRGEITLEVIVYLSLFRVATKEGNNIRRVLMFCQYLFPATANLIASSCPNSSDQQFVARTAVLLTEKMPFPI